MRKTPTARAYALAFGAAVRLLRNSRGQVELARAAGMSQPVLSRVEDGRALPDAYAAGKLAAALGTSSGELSCIVEEVLRRASEVAAAVYHRNVEPAELPNLPAADGLFLFLAGVIIHER